MTANPIAAATDTPPDVAQAEAEAREADDLLAALEERVRDGDDQVTPQQLAEQRELSGFAKLRAEAARRKANRAAAKAAAAEQAAAFAKAAKLLDDRADTTKLAATYENARTALAALVADIDDYNNAVTEVARILRAADAPEEGRASRKAPTTSLDFWGTPSVSIEPGKTHRPMHTGPFLATLLGEITHQVHMPPGSTAFERDSIHDIAQRHSDQVRGFLDRAAEVAK
ncbi:hypothetical protein [Streptomyces sp. NPDC002599]|uniref:hypothetical protein n=1 Tax=Streptomyces sp. NPDC002599 TaxID=3154421 RepID=UPI003327A318